MPNSRSKGLHPYTVVSFLLLIIAVFGTASLLLRGTLDNRSKATVAPIALMQTVTNGSTNKSDVSVSVSNTTGNLYLASISMKPWRPVKNVEGLGLSWKRVGSQCGARSSTGVEVWQAMGQPSGAGAVKATFEKTPENGAIAVSVIANAAQTGAILDVGGVNTGGENSDCTGGTDTDNYSASVHAVQNSISYAALAERLRANTPGGGFTETAEFYQGKDNGDKAGLVILTQMNSASVLQKLTGTLSSATDWALLKFVVQGGVATTTTPTPTPTGTPTPTVPGSTGTPVPTVKPSGTPVPTPNSTPLPPPSNSTDAIWVSRAQLAALPTSGVGWNNVLSEAGKSVGAPQLGNQDDDTNVIILAKAIVAARLGAQGNAYRDDVIKAIKAINASGTYSGRALALGREIGTYAVAADLIDLKTVDPITDAGFRDKLRYLQTAATSGGPATLAKCAEIRPNNWGTHCRASMVAIDRYLALGGDSKAQADIAYQAKLFKGWLGDRNAYANFTYDTDLTWQCDPAHPVGINPKGCTKEGHNIDGVLADDERRGGSFSYPYAPNDAKENYMWEALQGAFIEAAMLRNAGYGDVFTWQDSALLRAVQWEYTQNSYPAGGDDTWQLPLIDKFYGTHYWNGVATYPGKAYGWTDFVYQP